MGEVQDELMRGALETGVAVITPEMAMRDAWERYKVGGQALMRNLKPAKEWADSEPVRVQLPRATPARDYRIRLHTDRIDGPIWLRLLAQLGYAVGVADDECYGIGDVWASVPRTPESALRMGRRHGMSDEWMRRHLWGE